MNGISPYRQPAIERERVPDGVHVVEREDGALVITAQPYTPRVAATWALVTLAMVAAGVGAAALLFHYVRWVTVVVWPVWWSFTSLSSMKRRHRFALHEDGSLHGGFATYRPMRMEVMRGGWRLPRLYHLVVVLGDGTRLGLAQGLRRAQAEYVARAFNQRLETRRG